MFGQPVYLSQIYAASSASTASCSAIMTAFRRFGQPDNGELAAASSRSARGRSRGSTTIRNFMENGVLKITTREAAMSDTVWLLHSLLRR